jgi:dCTP deaminase
MLNANEICDRLGYGPGNPDRLSIVPRPNEEALKKRGGTSVDLRLGRWFRSFKPSKSSEAKLWLATPDHVPSALNGAPLSEPDFETEKSEASAQDAALGSGDDIVSDKSEANRSALPLENQWAATARHAMRTTEHFVPFGENFVLHPGRFVLGVTMEWLTLPKSLSGYVSGKSSLGRHGLVIETAAGLHPGFSGCLTLELANVGEVPIVISPGMEICQIFLHGINLHQGGDVGTFSGQRKPAISLPKRDPIFDKLRHNPR